MSEGTLRIIPLGGLGEIGLNLMLIEYCPAGSEDIAAIAVDCGLMFPEREMLGIDVVIPDFSYLREKRHLKGVVFTHGHEDHIGALPHLLREFNVPVYGTPFTLGLLHDKLDEHDLLDDTELHEFRPRQSWQVGPFQIEGIHVTHSIIDAVALAQEGRLALQEADYDLLLLDLGLPDEDGIAFLKSLRAARVQMPVLVLTARGAVDERIAGLDAGADDYLVKPFHNGELIARIRALTRRAPSTVMPVLEFAALQYDLASRQVICAGDEIALAPSEKGLLELLMRNGGQVVPKPKIEHAFSEFGDERSSNPSGHGISLPTSSPLLGLWDSLAVTSTRFRRSSRRC